MTSGAGNWWTAGAAGLAKLGAAVLPRVRRSLRAAPQSGASRAQPLAADLFSAFDMGAAILRTPEGTILHWSAGCERLFGFPANEALGRTAHELLGTRYPDGGRRALAEELQRTGEWQGELRHRRRCGNHVVVASHWILRRDPADGQAAAVLELHTDATALKTAEAALRAGEARLRLAQEVAGVGTWEWDPEEDSFVWSPEHYALFGLSPAAGEPDSLDAFLALVHPDDRDAVRAAAHDALASGEYLAEFRVLRPGRNGGEETLWLIGRGRRMPSPAGRVGPILGVNVDITARKEAEERQALLMREVDHRAKNALAVVQAVLRLTRAESMAAFAKAVEGRVSALARAQTLLTESRWTGADFQAMLRGELAPFVGSGGGSKVLLNGPPVLLAPLTAQPLSMALHELATNAAKYGSLSVPDGTLDLSWHEDPPGSRLRLRWKETGGPPVAGTPERRGFGSRVVETTVRDQLRGEVSFTWAPAGLVCDIDIPLHRVAAPSGG
ncbi:MAG: Chemotaxis protein methyltransferase CheR [uncultured Acetobacteraceae bacterium]|uniref:histidine kinase n=1 Tax=uncultured Acetobacteraceae bacterium TaxID=169975 RepID=A0A6J4JL39_9PROT|nr:MAG: Chemotaxis protein methyltransferase CheR [uncultured Acetobacteraceae bacterium]